MAEHRLARLWARRGTVRARTTAAAVLVAGLALVLAAVALVGLSRRSLTDGVQEAAWSRSEEVVDAIAATGRLPEPTPAADEELLQLLDPDGTVVASSSGVDASRPIAGIAPGHSREVDVPGAEEPRFLVVRAALPDPAGGSVLVGRTLDDVVESTRVLSRLLAAGVPLLLLVIGATAWVVIGRALTPVDEIRREVDEISSAELHRRVPAPATRDEVARLAETMNRMLERLEAAQHRQRRFVSDASHELRSPVATIRHHAEIALAHPERTSLPELAETVLAEDLRVQALVEDLLLLARSDEGTLGRGRQEVDVDDVVLDEARRLRVAAAHRVDSGQVSGGRVVGDPAQLARLVRNLGDNAARHARSQVALGVREVDGWVVLTVDDDGPGIAEDDRARVFERFVRLDEARSRDGGGAGLGLAIVAEVAAAHAGSVAALTGPLGGARIEVRLPGAPDGGPRARA